MALAIHDANNTAITVYKLFFTGNRLWAALTSKRENKWYFT
ncbi:putative phage related protein [Escherichia coli]|nr:putative phage related protein [Escherichia coli]